VSLFNILNDPRIGEIVVLDDASHLDEFEELKARLGPFSEKIRLFRREQNWGAFANKIQCVELCRSEWVVLLDYDNTLTPDYLNSLFNLEQWACDEIYCSAFAYPNFDFRESPGSQCIDLEMASGWMREGTFDGPFFNDGNYFLNRKEYLETLKPYWKYSVAASDVLFANYLWLSAGNRLKVLVDSWYFHRVHEHSSWKNQRGRSLQISSRIKKRIRDELPPTTECFYADFLPNDLQWVEPAAVPL
jgi:glycosyltransferase involved in cell wall biosynthesis